MYILCVVILVWRYYYMILYAYQIMIIISPFAAWLVNYVIIILAAIGLKQNNDHNLSFPFYQKDHVCYEANWKAIYMYDPLRVFYSNFDHMMHHLCYVTLISSSLKVIQFHTVNCKITYEICIWFPTNSDHSIHQIDSKVSNWTFRVLKMTLTMIQHL